MTKNRIIRITEIQITTEMDTNDKETPYRIIANIYKGKGKKVRIEYGYKFQTKKEATRKIAEIIRKKNLLE